MAGDVAGDGLIEQPAPARQRGALGGELSARRCRTRRIGNIVHQAHERVERAKRVALCARQHEKGVVEIAGGGARDAPAFGVGGRDGERWCPRAG